MQINSLDCCRPKRRINNFTGNYDSDKKRMPHKHYEQMSDDMLGIRSVIKAHNEVKHSPKGQLLKNMPKITTAFVLTSLALTQPGKLSAKAAAGLGFLTLFKSMDITYNAVNQTIDEHYKNAEPTKENEKNKFFLKTGSFLLTTAILSASAAVGLKAGKKIADKHFGTVANFVKKEAATLANEIDNTKLGKFFSKVVEPFAKKHQKTANAAKTILPFGFLAIGMGTQNILSKSFKEDVKNKSFDNFIKGKLIQAKAREEFDKIDAEEV